MLPFAAGMATVSITATWAPIALSLVQPLPPEPGVPTSDLHYLQLQLGVVPTRGVPVVYNLDDFVLTSVAPTSMVAGVEGLEATPPYKYVGSPG